MRNYCSQGTIILNTLKVNCIPEISIPEFDRDNLTKYQKLFVFNVRLMVPMTVGKFPLTM